MLEINNIYKSFNSCFEPVLKGVSLVLNPGDLCVLIGSNGSGKTTMFKTISGEYQPDSGTIVINGKDVTHCDIHTRAQFISSVSQDITKSTVQEMTLLENLALSQMRGKRAGYAAYTKSAGSLKEKVEQLGLGLEQYLNKPMASLSGGQRQMIATVMATLSDPSLLLLDEHCSALDPKTQIKLMEYTARIITKQNITALMITHNLNDAINYGNRLIMLHQGNIVADIKGKQKLELSVEQLLDLFHDYEDVILSGGV